jgi:hypothetical protein
MYGYLEKLAHEGDTIYVHSLLRKFGFLNEQSNLFDIKPNQIIFRESEEKIIDLQSEREVLTFLHRNSKFASTVREAQLVGETLAAKFYRITGPGLDEDLCVKVPRKYASEDLSKLGFLDVIYGS